MTNTADIEKYIFFKEYYQLSKFKREREDFLIECLKRGMILVKKEDEE